MYMQWILVKTFSFPYEAQIAKTQLEAFGIPVRIENEHMVVWGYPCESKSSPAHYSKHPHSKEWGCFFYLR